MKVEQIAPILKTITTEILGDSVVVNEDLSNIVDIGTEVFNQRQVENYTRVANDVIGKMVFDDRDYQGRAPSVLKDGWEFGSILEKFRSDIPEAQENESWELEDGASYDPNIFTKPKVSVKLYNGRVTYEVPVSIVDKQVKSAFNNQGQMNRFFSMIYNKVNMGMTLYNDSLIMRTINNMIAETVYNEYQGVELNTKSGVRAVNLLYLYNQHFSENLTAEQAILNPAFIRFAALHLGLYVDRLKVASKLFNINGTTKFTPQSKQHIVMLSEFAEAADVYLQSDVFHDEKTKLPYAERVVFWQGSGTDYSFSNTSKIDVKTAGNNTVTVSGVLACIFDDDALGVTNEDKRITSNYNGKAEFTNFWHKWDAGYFNDYDENFVVFFVA